MLQESMLILHLVPCKLSLGKEFTWHLFLLPMSMSRSQKPVNPKHLLSLGWDLMTNDCTQGSCTARASQGVGMMCNRDATIFLATEGTSMGCEQSCIELGMQLLLL